MKRPRVRFVWVLLAATLAVFRGAGQEPAPAADPVVEKILAEIKEHNEIMANLEYLTDMIGPRLTGTEKMNQASHWTMEMFQKYGLANVRLEPWTIARAWYRGPARARIVSPSEHRLGVASMGWSPSTAGAVRGRLVYVNARRVEELQQYHGKLNGAIAITAEPAPLPAPYEAPTSPLLSPAGTPLAAPASPRQPPTDRFARAREEFFKSEGVAAVLRDSAKEHALLNMGGIGGRNYEVGLVPTAFVTAEDYRLLWRLMQRGPVELEIELKNSFSDQPVEVYNTVAEIPGSEKADEVVLLGAHLDSWDLATGATDNGTGSMVVLEAARALQKLGLKPKRTIRFILFSGEEQGLVGSRKYVEAHRAELSRFSAILVHDTGTGRVQSIGLHGNYQAREVMDRVVAPLREVGLLELSMRRLSGTDHASFNGAGVPGFFCIQEPAEYRETHHSQSDTFDKVRKDDLAQGAQVLAVWAYRVAEWPELLPRRPAAETQVATTQE